MVIAGSSTFGSLLRRYRLAAGLTQEELAARAHLSARAVTDLERGVRRAPRKDTVQLLAGALALSAPERARFEAAARGRGTASSSPAGGDQTPLSRGRPALPPLVGRARELALMERHLAGAGPPLVLLAGEPGIGKSRLLAEASAGAWHQGWTVLEGGCQRRSGQEPYAPLLQAVARHLHRLSPAQRRVALQGCAWLVRLLPELREVTSDALPAWTLPPEQERRLMFAAASQFLANVAGTAGTLLVLDDLHWAGSDALDLLDALMRSAGEMPVRVLGAYRDSEVRAPDPLGVLLADLAHAGLMTQRTLVPLHTAEVEQLLNGLLEDREEVAVRERVVQRAGGVPFFVVSCAQALRETEERDSDADVVPWDVAQSVRQRVAALPEPARELLDMAAVIGRVVPPSLLIEVSAQPERAVYAAMDAASRARLLVEDEQAYQFAHDVIREVVEADVGTARRRSLHRRIAEVLERSSGELPLEALAYHYGQSDLHERAAVYLERAGDQATARRAIVAAEQYYREAIARLEGVGRAGAAAAARAKVGTLLHTMARYDAALIDLERAAETYHGADDLERLGRTVAEIGLVHAKNGTWPQGITRLRTLLDVLEPTGATPALAALHLSLTGLYFVAERFPECVATAEEAARVARALGDTGMLYRAQAGRAVALLRLGPSQRADALRALEEVGPLVEAVGDLNGICNAFAVLGWAYCHQGDFAATRRCVAHAIAAAEQMGEPALIANLLHTDGVRAFLQGAWAEARALFERSRALLQPLGGTAWDAWPLLGLGELSLAEGAWDQASHQLETGLAAAERGSHPESRRVALRLLAERALLQGDPAAALARIDPVLDQLGPEDPDAVALMSLQARAYLELGDPARCEAILGPALAGARAMRLQMALVDALWVRATAAGRQGHWEEAGHALDEGLALARSLPYPHAEARLLRVSGEMHVRNGEPQRARECLEASLAIFRRLGARKDAAVGESMLAGLSRPTMRD